MRLASIAVAFVLGLATASVSAQTIPRDAAHCALDRPPPAAGEVLLSGGTPMKIFPRAKDIPANFTGCQKYWAFHRKWLLFGTRYFEKGEIKIFLGALIEGQDQAHCYYANGRKSASSTLGCPTYDEASKPLRSVPAGCIGELQSNAPSSRCDQYE